MRTLRNFARIIIAPVFIFSGFVKAIDPLGSTYKFSDYFEAFGLDFMMPAAFILGILLSTAELLIGLSLLMGMLMRVTSWALLVFMSFFTILTFIIAVKNPVTDCGCFGDALILTNWQTFWKNIILLIPTLIVFFNRRYFEPFTNKHSEWGIAILFTVIAVGLSVVTYNNLPFMDFRPYKVGTHIPTDMTVPEGAPVDEFEAIFIYEKNGEQKEFSADNIPYQDTSWKYVDRVTKLVKKGYEPPIHDFSLTTIDGEEITDSVLNDKGYSFLVISHKLEKANLKGLKKVNSFVEKLGDRAKVYGMTASNNSVIDETDSQIGFNYSYHTTDEITLKTIIRSTPGIVMLKEGTVVSKWHYNNLPEIEENDLLSFALKYREKNSRKWINGFFIFGLAALMLFLVLIARVDDVFLDKKVS